MIRRMFVTLLLLALLGIGGHDVWRLVQTETHLRDVTFDLATWAADNATNLSRDDAASQVASAAQTQNIALTGYDQEGGHVVLETREEVRGTIALAACVNLFKGVEVSKVRQTPFYVTNRREAGTN